MITVDELERLKYLSRDIEFSFMLKLSNKLIALHGRRAFFNKFCAENGIDLPLVDGRKYVVPEEYRVDSDRIRYFGKIRDKAIFASYSVYEKIELKLNGVIAKKKEDITSLEKYISRKKDIYGSIKEKLKKEKDPSEYISLQSQEALLKTEIENQSIKLDEYNNDLALLLGVGSSNLDNWNQQVESICAAIDVLANNFLRDLGKKVTQELDYMDFVYTEPKFSERVTKIVRRK